MKRSREDYVISTSASRLDLGFICSALAGSYWARSRSRAAIRKSIRNSLSFGIYERRGGRQVAFARIVTDAATFSWLCDVVVDDAHRGRGLGKRLVSAAVSHRSVRGTKVLLGTRDAHGLYAKFGFVRCESMRLEPAGAAGSKRPRKGALS
jgi:GNAT superfamily N-acetyltransferase